MSYGQPVSRAPSSESEEDSSPDVLEGICNGYPASCSAKTLVPELVDGAEWYGRLRSELVQEVDPCGVVDGGRKVDIELCVHTAVLCPGGGKTGGAIWPVVDTGGRTLEGT